MKRCCRAEVEFFILELKRRAQLMDTITTQHLKNDHRRKNEGEKLHLEFITQL